MKRISGSILITMLLAILTLPIIFLTSLSGRVLGTDGGSLQDVYVNISTGSDSYDGSSPVHTTGSIGPVQHIVTATGRVATDGTIHVAAGTYVENVHLGSNMNLIGAGALTTIIDGGANGYPVVKVSSAPGQHNAISGFTVRNGRPGVNGPGGGIYISSDHIVTINDCAIINNSKDLSAGDRPGNGGGVCNENGALSMYRCTVSGNTASILGGGIANINTFGGGFGIMELTNCTVSGNTVTGDGAAGGGVYNSNNAEAHLLNVTIADNHATHANSFGGGFANNAISSIYFKNCIVANNTAGHSESNNGYDGLGTGTHSQGNNLDSQDSCFFHESTDQINTNPRLGSLQNNGGPTSTMAITPASPAYNRGTNDGAPATDQRGVTRPQYGFFDIGAYEFVITDVRTGTVNTTLGAVTFAINTGSISGLANIDPGAAGCAPAGFGFPYGYFGFTISNLSNGQSVKITITLPSPLPMGAIKYFKCINGALVDVTSLISQPDPGIIILTLTDGGLGDADGAVNGKIVDPGGPCLPLNMGMPQSSSPWVPTVQGPAAMANVTVKSASLSATKVAPGSPVTVTATVANQGTANGSARIRLLVNGQEDSTQGVSVASGSTAPVKFTVTRNEPGTYSVYVGGVQAGSFTVDTFADPNIILYLSGAAIFFAFIIGVIYVARRRQR